MYLGNPLLPINITAQAAAELIKKELEEKYWSEYEQKSFMLDLVPYFLFNYHYYLENEGDGKHTIKSAVHGLLAIDGHNIVVREDLVKLLKHNWKKATPEIPRGEFHENWNNIEKREQDEVLQLKTAEHFGVPKTNVVISSAKKMLVPFYSIKLLINEEEYWITINALDGTVQGLKEIPERKKGYRELTKETISDLKKPSAWIKYSKEAITEGIGAFGGKKGGEGESKHSEEYKHSDDGKEPLNKKVSSSLNLSFLDSKLILILIMILGLLLIFMGLFRIKPF
ncbi:MAG: hypothetical protein WC821_01940 [archaeon]|jgi:hypothetical protein